MPLRSNHGEYLLSIHKYRFSGSRLGRDGYSGSFYRLTPAADSLKKQRPDRLRHSLYQLSMSNCSTFFEKVNMFIMTII